ncbi:MAG: ACT domain-containing protein [Lachnospiraceae bacterium]|nr:ACT domain-containing protein [Lachnospiraceae bacterium]
MAIKQLTVFVENKQGTMVSITEILSKNNINIRALSIAETQDFGILRLIVNDEEAAKTILADAGYLIKITDVVGVKIGDAPGKLCEALKVLDESNINLEYLYAFMARTEKHAYVVLRVEDNAAAENVLVNAGFHLITEADIKKL